MIVSSIWTNRQSDIEIASFDVLSVQEYTKHFQALVEIPNHSRNLRKFQNLYWHFCNCLPFPYDQKVSELSDCWCAVILILLCIFLVFIVFCNEGNPEFRSGKHVVFFFWMPSIHQLFSSIICNRKCFWELLSSLILYSINENRTKHRTLYSIN